MDYKPGLQMEQNVKETVKYVGPKLNKIGLKDTKHQRIAKSTMNTSGQNVDDVRKIVSQKINKISEKVMASKRIFKPKTNGNRKTSVKSGEILKPKTKRNGKKTAKAGATLLNQAAVPRESVPNAGEVNQADCPPSSGASSSRDPLEGCVNEGYERFYREYRELSLINWVNVDITLVKDETPQDKEF